MGQYLPSNSNNAILYGISKDFETSKFYTKQRYLNLTANTDPRLFFVIDSLFTICDLSTNERKKSLKKKCLGFKILPGND